MFRRLPGWVSGVGWVLLIQAGEALASSEAHGAEEGIPTSLIFSGINFLILVGALIYFLKKPAKDFFASRSTLIKRTITQAQELKDHAQAKHAEYEGRLKNIEAETKDLVEKLKLDGDLERRRIIETAERQVKNLRETQVKVLDQELRKAKEELKKEAVNLAGEMAEKLIRENMTPDDQNRLVGQYLEKMEKLA